MIQVDACRFRMGSNEYKNEQPVRIVSLAAFSVDPYPVTNERFATFIAAGGYDTRDYWTEVGWSFIKGNDIRRPLYFDTPEFGQPRQPVTGVSWWEAMAFAAFEDKTLPTEAQWEYIAGRGEDRYPWGDAEPTAELANFAPGCEPAELDRRSTPVDAFPKAVSRVGCWDVAGNVGEWCIDNASRSYAWDFYGFNPVFLTAETDPHVVRGGSGLHDEDCLRCASRDYYRPELRDNIVGFRCVRNEI
ncbi:formylglycine-generating enzyme family protein [Caenispirillum salinarum]|uniref:formylglycine-generating enzyme family protein n=1 Tax=Caenispirillum salinarum TaxID=859058 RepID=UPI00384BEFDA